MVACCQRLRGHRTVSKVRASVLRTRNRWRIRFSLTSCVISRVHIPAVACGTLASFYNFMFFACTAMFNSNTNYNLNSSSSNFSYSEKLNKDYSQHTHVHTLHAPLFGMGCIGPTEGLSSCWPSDRQLTATIEKVNWGGGGSWWRCPWFVWSFFVPTDFCWGDTFQFRIVTITFSMMMSGQTAKLLYSCC